MPRLETNNTPAESLALDQAHNVMGSTEVNPREEGTRPFRFVLRFLRGNVITPYVVHMETDPHTASAGMHNGRYCANMGEAYDELLARAKRHGLKVLDFNHRPVRNQRR
jgi:hypothetical protein